MHPIINVPTEHDIDLRLAALRVEILDLCETRNAHYAATSKLPPEILVHIFEYVIQTSCDGKNRGSHREHYSWVSGVTHVCRSWRSVALATPGLWSSAFLSPQEWAFEALRRARTTPLDLFFPTLSFYGQAGVDRDLALVEAALANPDQIRAISLPMETASPSDTIKLLTQLVSSSTMPLLEKISVHNRFSACPIPDSLFDTPGSAPRLRELKLHNCTLDLNTPRFYGLSTLRLSSDVSPLRNAISPNALLRALREMHALEVLALDHIFSEEAEDGDPFSNSTEPFVLPLLCGVSLSSAGSPAPLRILRVIETPCIRNVSIEIDPVHGDNLQAGMGPDVITAVYSFFRRGTSSPEYPKKQSLNIGKSYDQLHYTVTQAWFSQAGSDRKMLTISNIEMRLAALWSVIPHDNLHSLTLSPNLMEDNISRAFVDAVLSLADSKTLEELNVPYLSFADEGLLATWRQSSAFPGLRTLVLDCLNIKPRHMTLMRLRDWLIAREEQGFAKLEVLKVIDCPYLKATIVGLLKGLVEHFHHSRPTDGDAPP